MLTVEEIRAINIRKLRETYSRAELALAIGASGSYISQVTGKPPKPPSANIGSPKARKIEKCLGLPRGWMDHEHHDHGINEELAAGCIEKIVETIERKQMQELSPRAFAAALAALYNTSLSTGEVVDPLAIIKLSVLAEKRR